MTVPDHQCCDRPRLTIGLTSGQLSDDRSQHVGEGGASAEFFREPYEKTFGPANVAEPIRVFVLDHFVADELRAVLTEPGERLVDVVHGEHDAQVAESVHRGVPVIGDHRRREKARELEPAVAVRRAHHGDLDALVA